MEIKIFVGQRGTWVVVQYPEITEDNALLIEMLQEAENDRSDTVDTAKVPPGLRKVKVTIEAAKSSFESPYEDDCWIDFELIN